MFYIHHCPDSQRNVLQLFIITTGKWDPLRETTLSTQERLPSDRECSIIISSEVFFSNIIGKSFGGTNLGLQLEGVQPDNNQNHDKAWSASATAGSASAPFGQTLIDSSVHSSEYSTSYFEDYIRAEDCSVTVSIVGMKFTCAGDKYDVSLSFDDKGVSRHFEYGFRSKLSTAFDPGEWSSINYKDHEFTVTITMNANLHFSIEGTRK